MNWTIGEDLPEGADGHEFWPENYREGMPMRYFPSDFRLLDPMFPPKDDPKLYTHEGERYYLPFEATICILQHAELVLGSAVYRRSAG